jgi:hypothetical protein
MNGERNVEERYYGQGAGELARLIVSSGKRGDTPHATRQAAAGIIALAAGSDTPPLAAVSIRTLMGDAANRGGGFIPYAVHVAGASIPNHRLCIACSAQYCRDAASADWVEEAPLYWEQGAPLGCTTCGEYYGREAHCDTCRCNVEGGRS